ncbi:hypothetical protein VIGAN_11148400, partial [Vigna angularis var. angularis]
VFDKIGEAFFFPSFFSRSDAVFTGRGDSLSLLVAVSISQGGRRFRGKGFLFWDYRFLFFPTDGWPKVGVSVLANCSCNLGVKVCEFLVSSLISKLGWDSLSSLQIRGAD